MTNVEINNFTSQKGLDVSFNNGIDSTLMNRSKTYLPEQNSFQNYLHESIKITDPSEFTSNSTAEKQKYESDFSQQKSNIDLHNGKEKTEDAKQNIEDLREKDLVKKSKKDSEEAKVKKEQKKENFENESSKSKIDQNESIQKFIKEDKETSESQNEKSKQRLYKNSAPHFSLLKKDEKKSSDILNEIFQGIFNEKKTAGNEKKSHTHNLERTITANKSDSKSENEKSAIIKKNGAGADTVKVELDPQKWSVFSEIKNTVNEHDSSTKMEKLSSLKKSKTNVENLIQHGIEKKNGAAQNMQNDGSQSGMEFGHFRKDNGISNMFRLETSSRLEDAKSQQSFNELVEKARMNFGSDGRSSASIRMNPAHFGRMTLNIEMQNNQLQAKLLVESSDAKKMIMDEIENLRQELRNHGIQVESISVKVKEPAQVFSSKEFDENSEFQSENPDGNNSSQYEERNKENSTGIDNLQFLGLEIEQEIENNLVEQSSVGNINISI